MLETILDLFKSKDIKIEYGDLNQYKICLIDVLDLDRTDKKLVNNRNRLLRQLDKFCESYYSQDLETYMIYEQPEYKNLNEKIDKLEADFKTYPEIYNSYSTESFAKALELEKLESYDAYGSGLYRLDNKEFYMFDNYGCSQDGNIVFTAYIMDKNTYEIEIGNICYDIIHKKFYIDSKQVGIFPKELRKYHIENFTGKRTFYWHPDKKIIFMRCSEELYDNPKFPKKYKAPEKYRQNISGVRIKVKLF